MNILNPLSWFTAAKAEAVTVEQKAESIAISLETEAYKLVTNFQSVAVSSAKDLASIKARLEADIAKKQAALAAVNGELTKAQSVVPTDPQPSPQPEQPVAQ